MSAVRGPGAVIAAIGTAVTSLVVPAVIEPIVSSAPIAEASAGSIVVTGSCTLNDAVAAANAGSTVGGCTNGGGSSHILIENDPVDVAFSDADPVGTLVTTVSGDEIAGNRVALPWITTDIIIEGVGNAGIYSGFTDAPLSRPRLAYVAAGASLTLRNTSVAGFVITGATSDAEQCDLSEENESRLFCFAQGSFDLFEAGTAYGAAIYADGALTLEGVVMHDNTARGGSSGFRVSTTSSIPERAPRGGGDAIGGAVYATGVVTIVDSAFHGNRVIGGDGKTGVGVRTTGSFFADPELRDGGNGGDAYGADVAFGSNSTATLRSVLFDGSQAAGGDGAYGSTLSAVKNLERPLRASDGRNGRCDDTPKQREVDGKDGGDGFDGSDGANGGDAGDARGVIHTAGRLILDSVTVTGALASGGAAGSAGLPQLGGEGGDGGDGVDCGSSSSGVILSGGSQVKNGDPGDGGNAGWHGAIFPNGDRATAIAAVSGTTLSSVTMVNTSILDSTAELTADNVDDFTNRDSLLDTLGRLSGLVGVSGTNASGDFGTNGRTGPRADLGLLRSGAAGDMTVVSIGEKGRIAYSTFADNVNQPFSGAADFSDGATARRLVDATSGVPRRAFTPVLMSETVIAPNTVGSDPCFVDSFGNNVLDDASTCFTPGPDDRDQPRLVADDSPGPALATDGFGTTWSLPTRAPRLGFGAGTAGQNAINVRPEPCDVGLPVDDGNDTVPLDARGAPRGDGFRTGCDAGAHELIDVTASIDFAAPQSHVAQPLVPPVLNDRYEVEQIDVRYVAPAGSPDATVTVEADPLWGALRCVGFTCTTSEEFRGGSNTVKIVTFDVSPTTTDVVQSFDISVEANGNESITMTADLDTPFAFASDAIDLDFPYLPGFTLSEAGSNSVVGRCRGSMAFNYEIDLTGPSMLPDGFSMTVDPAGSFFSNVKSGGGTVSAGTWTPSRLDRVGESASIQVIDAPGNYAVGTEVEPTLTYFAPQSAPNITIVPPTVAGLGNVRTIAPDPQIEVTFTGWESLDVGESGTIDVEITNNASAGCGDITGVTYGISDGGGSTVYVAGTIGTLPGGVTQSFSFPYTAPGTPESDSFEFEVDFDHSELVGGPVVDEFGFSVEADPAVPTVTAQSGPFGGPDGGPLTVAPVFDVVFDKAVTGFGPDDVIIAGSAGGDTADVQGSGAAYTVEVTGMDQTGEVEIGIRSGAAVAAVDNSVSSTASNRDSVNYDLDGPAVIVNWIEEGGWCGGAFFCATPVVYNVDVIDELDNPQPGPVDVDDLVISGTAQPSGFSISEPIRGGPIFGPGSRTFRLSIANVANPGSVDVRVDPANDIVDAFGNPAFIGELEFQSPTVQYIAAPDAPTGAAAVAGDGHAVVSWTPPDNDGGLTLERYEVQVTENPSAGTPTWDVAILDVPPDETAATVTGLTNGVPVAFRVLAVNLFDQSEASNVTDAVTPNPVPVATVSPAASQPNPTSTGPIEFEVEFDVPVTGFDAFDVDLGGTVGASSITVTPDAPASPNQSFVVTVDGLTGQGDLTMSVRDDAAVRSTGQANEASDPATVVFDSVPPVAVVDLAAGQLAVTDDPVVEFGVFFGEAVAGFDADDISVAGTAGGTVQSITPVTPAGDRYVVTITAGAARGTVQVIVADGAAADVVGFASSTVVVADTVELITVPNAPAAPRAAAADGVVELTWTAPSDDGGRPVVLYEVQQSTDGGPWLPAETESGTAYIETNAAVIDGLANDVAVRFRVAAVNQVGRGARSSAAAFSGVAGSTGGGGGGGGGRPPPPPTPPPTVVLARSPGQPSSTESAPIRFTARFDQPVSGVDPDSVFILGPTGATGGDVTGSGSTYEISIEGMTQPGEVRLVIADDAAANTNGQGNLESNVASVDFSVTVPAGASPWTPVVPARFLETRDRPTATTFDGNAQGIGRLPAGETTRLQIGGRGGLVPPDAIGVIVNVTAIRPFLVGYVTAWSCEGDRPFVSSLNYSPGVTLGNEVVVELGADAEICLFNSAETDLTVDVTSYLAADSVVELVTPARLVETRDGPNNVTIDGVLEGGGPLAAGEQIEMQIAGRGGIDPGAVAVIANLTAVKPQAVGYFTPHPCLDDLPLASSLNYVPNTTRGNEIVLQLDENGRTCLFTSAASDMTLDVVGFLPAGASFTPVGPARLVETRSGPNSQTIDGNDLGGGPLDAGETREIQVAGRAGIDPDATSATLYVSAVQPLDDGFFTMWPCESGQPLAATLNYAAGVNGGSEVVAGLSSRGTTCIFTQAETHLTIDVTGSTAAS